MACSAMSSSQGRQVAVLSYTVGPCPMQLLPRIGLKWIVPIEALHAVTYACGWSGKATLHLAR